MKTNGSAYWAKFEFVLPIGKTIDVIASASNIIADEIDGLSMSLLDVDTGEPIDIKYDRELFALLEAESRSNLLFVREMELKRLNGEWGKYRYNNFNTGYYPHGD